MTHWRGRVARTVAGTRLRRTATSVDSDIKTLDYPSLARAAAAAGRDGARCLAPCGSRVARARGRCGASWLPACGMQRRLSDDASSATPTASSARPPSIPPDGITLAALGYLNGPVQQFSLPRTAVITAKVDQPNNVAAVVSSPSPAEMRSYLLRALPAAGFEITADRPASNTMTLPVTAGAGASPAMTADRRCCCGRAEAVGSLPGRESRRPAGSLLRARSDTTSGRMS